MDGKVFAGKYRTIRELNGERAGRTWLAEAPDGMDVVVKVVSPVDEVTSARLEHEVSLLSGIHGPGLPQVLEWGHGPGEFFVVRPFIPGADLALELGQQGVFAPQTVAKYGRSAAKALGLIHARGLVHGNVRTANLIRTPEDEIVLVGGGIGHPSQLPIGPDMPPTVARYLAPEQVEGGPVTPATDVYALGVVMYELLSGRVPFDGPTVGSIADQQAHKAPEPLSLSVPDVPEALQAVVMRALEKAPEARYADGDELAAALDEAMGVATAPPVVVEETAESRIHGWMWAAIAALVVLLLVLAAWVGGLFGPGRVAVPDLTGKTPTEAAAALAVDGLKLGSATFAGAPVPGVADGTVSSQVPAAGSKVVRQSSVNVVLAGSESVTVPNVVGQTEAQAVTAIQAAGLVTGVVTNVATTAVSAGTVLSQAPVAGSTAVKGSGVDLQVAQVPTASAVPNVVGMKRDAAGTALQSAGFVATFVGRASASVANGTVIEQNPSAGVTARPGSTVTVVVSTGPSTTAVPAVVGMTQAAAVNALTAAGFKTQITQQTGGGTVGNVIDQSPSAGTKAPTGSTVTITVVQ